MAIHPGALGDVLLAIPALRALRAQRPAHPLVLAAQPRIGRLLALLEEVDEAVDFEALGLGGLFVEGALPSAHPRLASAGRVVCWFGSRDPAFAGNLRRIAPGAIVAPPAGDGALGWSASPSAPCPLVWQHLRRTVGAPLEGDTEICRPSAIHARAGRHALRAAGSDAARPALVLHPGAGGAAKRWPVEGFGAVAREVARWKGLALVIHEGPADGEAAAALLAVLGPGAVLLRQPPLETLAGVLAGAAAYLGNDSGVSHLAAAVGAPGVVLFTPALLAWRPWAPAARVAVVAASALTAGDLARVQGAIGEALA